MICIDEKTGIQARYRRYPERPPRPGRLARREFEYVRNGTVSIIAALHVATGQVIAEPIDRNDSVTFTGFLHRLDQCIDPRLNIHLVMDNGSSHTSRATRAWIAAHPRITVTCTPKHASWLDVARVRSPALVTERAQAVLRALLLGFPVQQDGVGVAVGAGLPDRECPVIGITEVLDAAELDGVVVIVAEVAGQVAVGAAPADGDFF